MYENVMEHMGFIWFYSFTWWENKKIQKTTFLLKDFTRPSWVAFTATLPRKRRIGTSWDWRRDVFSSQCAASAGVGSRSTPSTPKTVAMGLPSSLLLWMAGDYGWTSLDVLGRDRSWILILPPINGQVNAKIIALNSGFSGKRCLTTKGIFNHIPLPSGKLT